MEKVFIQVDNKKIELSGAELESFQQARVEYAQAIKDAEDKKSQAKAALLERLGITADEAALLLG